MDKKSVTEKMTLQQKADMLTGRDFWSTAEYPGLGVRSMYLSDGPHGLRKQAAASDHLGLNPSLPATCFPTASVMACSWDPALGERMGEALGDEAASMGVDVLLGPGLNIKRNPLCGRNFEYFSEDPYLAGKMAASYVRGIQSRNVAACVKHFAANNREYRRMTSDSVIDEKTLREIYLRGFEIALEEGGAKCIMTSYNKINGIFSDENPHLLCDILRGEWGFGGTVITDWAGGNSRVRSIACGSDLEMPACRYGAEDLVRAVEAEKIPESLLDESVSRILALEEFTAKKQAAPFDADAHHALARECAENSAVLLKNDGVLPLKEGTEVAVIGDFAFEPRYQGAGSSVVNPTRLPVAKEVFGKGIFRLVGCERGFDRYGKKNKRLAEKALRLAAQANVILFFAGLDEVTEAEGLDRKDMRLPLNQLDLFRALAATGKKIVVLLHCGAAVEMGWAQPANAILWMGLAGQAGAEAEYRLLTGEVNPSGKLAESWAEKYEDYSTADPALFPGGEDEIVYSERDLVGYRWFTEKGIRPLYPFGFGLSYTRFGYFSPRVSRESVAFTLKNEGDTAGREVAQVYSRKKGEKKLRLIGFVKAELGKGEEKRLELPLDGRAFEEFDASSGSWKTAGGVYEIGVGGSSEELLWTELEVDGEEIASAEMPAGEEYRQKPHVKGETVHENTTVGDLRYAKGWTGRLFSAIIRAAIRLCGAFGMRTQANTLVMGVLHQPVRGLAKFGGMTRRKMEGLLWMFNGYFFKGLRMFFSRKEKDEKKAEK